MQLSFISSTKVPKAGYEWYDSGDYSMLNIGTTGKNRPKSPPAQRRLVARPTSVAEDDNYVVFDPFGTASGMFIKFAELDGSEEAILEFTNRYGRLWNDLKGPCLSDYQDAIEDLRDAVDLWHAVQERNTERLKRFLEWDKAGRLRWKTALAQPITHDGKTIYFVDVKFVRKYKPGDLLGPATALLDFVIATRPTWDMQVMPRRRAGVLTLFIEVRDLLHVLWIQFILAVAEDKNFGHCQFCNEPFELTPQVNRADRLFCSDNCRVKAYQRRRKQAIAMKQQGKPLREIVKATASDMESVKKWITDLDTKENSSGKKTSGKQ